MKLLNIELEHFLNFLMNEELDGKKSRMRTRFCRLLAERIKQINSEKNDLINKHCKKNEDDSLATTKDEQGRLVYDIDNVDLYNKEYKELILEEFILDNLEERKDMFLAIKDITLNTKQVFSGQKALDYDRFCEIVETIEY